MNTFDKIGDLLIDLAKYIFGGVVLGAIMVNRDGTDVTMLYLIGSITMVSFILLGFGFYWLQKRK